VYSAIYSGVPVYEISVRDMPVMRRMGDSYMNATQILKVAGFNKAKRSKILDNEVLNGTHEKVQGGYGKYQGTWIPLESGAALAEKYGVEKDLLPIVAFVPGIDFATSKPNIQKRRNSDDSSVGNPRNEDFFDGSETPPHKTFSPPGEALTDSRLTPARSRVASSNTLAATSPQREPRNLFDEDQTQHQFFKAIYSRRKNRSKDFAVTDISNYDYPPPKNSPSLDMDVRKKKALVHIYTEQDNALNIALFFELLRSDPPEKGFLIDLELDSKGNTALHWATSCSRMNLVECLLARGANSTQQALDGHTPLMRAVNSGEPFRSQTFQVLMKLLSPSVFSKTSKGETVLHQIALLSRFRSKRQRAQYYMQCIVRHIEENKLKSTLFAEFIDQPDSKGDTALHIACKYRNHGIAVALLDLNASKMPANLEGETPFSYCGADPRLRKLMEIQPQNDYDDYLDAPTTPMSDVSIESDSEIAEERKSLRDQLIRKASSSTISNSGMIEHAKDSNVLSTFAHLGSAKVYLHELRWQKDRFSSILRTANKIEGQLLKSGTKSFGATTSFASSGTEEHDSKRQKLNTSGQKLALQETKLSSQLQRLEALVKASQEEQEKLIKNIDLIKQERSLKDARYLGMMSTICQENPEMMEDILDRVISMLH